MAVFEEVFEPTGLGGGAGTSGDSHSNSLTSFSENIFSSQSSQFTGGRTGSKITNRQFTAFARYEIDIPVAATSIKAKLRLIPSISTSTLFPMVLGLLNLDGHWDLMAGDSVGFTPTIDPYVNVFGDSLTLVTKGNNGGIRGVVSAVNAAWNRVTVGGSLKADTAVDNLELIQIQLDLFPSTPTTGSVQLEIYDVVSEENPRPTGPVIARSDSVLRSAIPSLFATFIDFDFSGGDQISIAEDQLFAFKIVDAAAPSTMFDNIRMSVDPGYSDDDGGSPNPALTNNVSTLMFQSTEANGFHTGVYLCTGDYPLPFAKDSAVLIPGVVFQDTFPSFNVPDYVATVQQEWGDAGYAADGELALGAEVADWIAEPGYDPAGSPIGILWRSDRANPNVVHNSFSEDGGSAPKLVIEYTLLDADPPTDPDPADEANCIPIDQILSWTTGAGTFSFDVYFGTDPSPDAGEFQGNQAGTTFDPGTLAIDVTYYWRIDAIGATGTATGEVWSFTTLSVPALVEDGGDVTQFLLESAGDVTQVLTEDGQDATQIILEIGGDVIQILAEDGQDATQTLLEVGGDVTQVLTEDGQDVTQVTPEIECDVTQALTEDAQDVTQVILEVGGDVVQILLEGGEDVTQTLDEDGGDVIVGDGCNHGDS